MNLSYLLKRISIHGIAGEDQYFRRVEKVFTIHIDLFQLFSLLRECRETAWKNFSGNWKEKYNSIRYFTCFRIRNSE